MVKRITFSALLSLAFALCGAVCRPVSVNVPLTDGDLGGFETYNISGVYRDWHFNGAYGIVVNAWGSNYVEDDWLVSPEYDFTGMESFSLSFEHCLYKATTTDFASEVLHVYITDEFTGDVNTTQWTELTVSQWSKSYVYATASAADWSKWTDGIRFAFRLTHDPAQGREGLYWELRNLTLTTTCSQGAGNPGQPDTPTDRFVVRFKGHNRVWTAPVAVFTDNSTENVIQTSAMQLVGAEGDYNLWEKEIDGDELYETFFAENLAVAIRQNSYSADYHSGRLQTLPRLLLDDGMHCFIAGNLDGEANIESDGNSYDTWYYVSQESNYNVNENNTIGRQTGMLFDTECNDLDHHVRYASLVGKSGTELWDAVNQIENRDKRVTTYMALRGAYMVTDYSTYGNILDMYSNMSGTYRYPQGTSGNSSEISAVFNREHSLPKSWWKHDNNNCIPAFTDIVHVIPANGYVNEARSYYPYGEVGSAQQTFGNGSKVGNSSFSGYTGLVYEPIDEYKGDFARIYFYMVTCYSNVKFNNYSTGGAVFNYISNKSDFTTYGKNLFMKWARNDEVSDFERRRNDGVQSIQGNRNPFVDLPNLAEYLWGTKTGKPYSFDDMDTAVEETAEDTGVSAWRQGEAICVLTTLNNVKIEHFDITGRLLGTYTIGAPSTISINSANGVSLIRATDERGNVRTIKVIK
ncbi:MAG: endonuclease [Paludibacteraceae bacterium]|nr:endonuclease [Paludibacteraceae bacterium]